MPAQLLEIPKVGTRTLPPPTLFVALTDDSGRGSSVAEGVLGLIRARLEDPTSVADLNLLAGQSLPECHVVTTAADMQALYDRGHTPNRTVVIYADLPGKRHSFRHTVRTRPGDNLPGRALGALWGVACSYALPSDRFQGVANQLVADFVSNYAQNIAKSGAPGEAARPDLRPQEWFPFGLARRNEHVPVEMDAINMAGVLELLEAGPDFRGMLPTAAAAELPADTRLSWQRLRDQPLLVDGPTISAITVHAFTDFEVASRKLVNQDERACQALLAGVVVDPALRQIYLRPQAEQFSLRRLDLHAGIGIGDSLKPYASESDEMPGGLVEAYHLDRVYGLNQAAWAHVWDNLTASGTEALVFLVSTDWSKVYLHETRWLAGHLTELGYPAYMVTTEELDQLIFKNDGLYIHGRRINTINRLFPIHEATGQLVDVVMASDEGRVRLIPEFAFFGNKALFALFRSHADFYRKELAPTAFSLLESVIPDSHHIMSPSCGEVSGFPFTIHLATGEVIRVESLGALLTLPPNIRSEVVLKVAGTGPQVSRMYGVLMGNELPDNIWQPWIDDRIAAGQSFLVQERRRSAVIRVPVFNHLTKLDEIFACRALIRPWAFSPVGEDGALLTATITLVPSTTERVHGMVQMALVSAAFSTL